MGIQQSARAEKLSFAAPYGALVRFAACAIAVIATAVLAGWLSGVSILPSVVQGARAMAPLTALLFLISSAGLWLLVGNPDSRMYQAGGCTWALICMGGGIYGLTNTIFRISQNIILESSGPTTNASFSRMVMHIAVWTAMYL